MPFDPSTAHLFDPSTARLVDDQSPTAAKPQPAGMLERFATGIADRFVGGAQLIAHHIPKPVGDVLEKADDWLADTTGSPRSPRNLFSGEGADAAVERREKDIQDSEPKGADWARIAGNIASPVNYVGFGDAAGLGAMAKFARSALSGSMSAALEPVTGGGDFTKEKLKQVGEGAAAGGIMHSLGAGLGKVVSPEAKDLLAQGVRLTPGQIAGGVVRRGEEAAKSVPFLGSAIRHGESIARKDYNIAVYNQVLQPLGQKYAGDEVGHEGIKTVERQISKAYDDVLPHVTFTADPTFHAELQNLGSLVREMPPEQVSQFRNIIQNRLDKRLGQTGIMDGYTYKQVQSELSHLSANYHKSGDAAQRQLGDALMETNDMMGRNLSRQNPNYRPKIQAANQAWSRYARIRRAAGQRVSSDGEFTPGDLLAAIKGEDKSVGKGKFAKGEAPLQTLGRAGNKVLGNKLPDSGTPERAMWDLGGMAGGWAVNPAIPLGIAGGSALYTGPAMSALRGIATNAPSGAAFRSAPLASAAGAVAGYEGGR
jgi:hypothetical protein